MINEIHKRANQTPENKVSSDEQSRRELATKLGKFALYAAPFTVMAMNSQAATASGPRKGKP